MAFKLTSPAFGPDQPIPKLHSCDGSGVSPPLEWTPPPRGTKSLAVVVEDPDAPHGTFVHWLVYNIEPRTGGLLLAAGSGGTLPPGSIEGWNSAGRTGYLPACPPQGRHRYKFRLYAVSTVLRHRKAITKAELDAEIARHVLVTAELVGTYARPAATELWPEPVV